MDRNKTYLDARFTWYILLEPIIACFKDLRPFRDVTKPRFSASALLLLASLPVAPGAHRMGPGLSFKGVLWVDRRQA